MKSSAWTDDDRRARVAQRERDNADAYERVTVKDCQPCGPGPCKGHRLIVRFPMQSWSGVLK